MKNSMDPTRETALSSIRQELGDNPVGLYGGGMFVLNYSLAISVSFK